METTETTLQQFDDRAKVVADRVLAEYWGAIEQLIAREDLTPEQRDAEIDRIDAIRARIGKQGRHMTDVRRDLETMEAYVHVIDMQPHAETVATERNRLHEAARKLLEEAESHRVLWLRKADEGERLRNRAFGLNKFAQELQDEATGLATTMRDNGHPAPAKLRERLGVVSKPAKGVLRRFERASDRLSGVGYELAEKRWRS